MKPMFALGLLAGAVAFSAPAFAAETYTLDPLHTNVYWKADHLGFSKPAGKFADVTGTLVLDEAKPENSKVDATIKIASISTGIDKFDTHLESADFFDLAKFPTATYVSDKVEVTGKDTAKVHGTLTLHGVSKPVVLDVKLNKIGEHPMSKKKSVGFSATATVRRTDFGIKYGVPMVGDEIPLVIEAEASLADAAAKE